MSVALVPSSTGKREVFHRTPNKPDRSVLAVCALLLIGSGVVTYHASPSMSLKSKSVVVCAIGASTVLLLILSLCSGLKLDLKPGFSEKREFIELKNLAYSK